MGKFRVYADGNYNQFVEADSLKFAISLAEDLINTHRKAEIKMAVYFRHAKIRWYKVKYEIGKYKNGRRFIYIVE